MSQDLSNCKLIAILNAKVVRYNRLMKKNEEWTVLNLKENKELMSDIIHDYKGQVIDSREDNIIAGFCSSVGALECAVKIQQELKKKYSDSVDGSIMDFRIGIDIVEADESEFINYGDDISTSNRLRIISRQGGICISRRVHNHVKKKLDFTYEYLGEYDVKNVNDPMWIYRVVSDKAVDERQIYANKSAGVMSHKRIIATFIVLIFFAAGFAKVGLHKYGHESIKKLPMEPGQMILIFTFKESSKTIAVLPLPDLNSGDSQNHFAAGFTEKLFSCLCQVPDLSAVEKKRCFSSRGNESEIRNIVNKLNVDYIVAGNLRKNGSVLHFSAQLFDAYGESQICLKVYNIDMDGDKMNEILEDIAVCIVKECKEAMLNKRYI